MATALAVDSSLVLAARGDQAAFAELYTLYGQRIYNYVLRSVREPQGAEDVCQEVWIKAYRRLRHLREPAAFSTWLYRIASRACIDHARKHVAQLAELPDDAPAAARDRPDEIALRTESERLVWEALGSLPVRQHQALYLRAVEGRSYKEIATILEASESAIETLLFRARNSVAAAYDRLEDRGADRCALARKSMRVVIDGDANSVQRSAVDAHVNGCRNCRSQLYQMKRASAAYAVLPLFPLPPLFASKVLHAAAAGTSVGGGLTAKLLGLLSTKTKIAATALTISGGIAATAVIVPNDVPVSYVNVPAQTAAAVPAQPLAGDVAGGDVPGEVVPQAPSVAPPSSDALESTLSGLTALRPLSLIPPVLSAVVDSPASASPELPIILALPPLPLVSTEALSVLPTPPPPLDALPVIPLEPPIDVLVPLPTIAAPVIELPPLLPLPESTPVALPDLPPLIDLPSIAPLPELPLIP